MPAMRNSTGAGKTAAGRRCHMVLCAGRAGIVQHAWATMVQPGIIAPRCPLGQAGQGWPVLAPDGIGACICAAITASETMPPARPSPKASNSIAMRKRLTSDANMRCHHSTDSEDRQCRRAAISSNAHRPAAFGRRSVLLVVPLLASSMLVPQVDARGSPSFGRTQDHVHVIARQLGHADTILIALSIDPGYHVNANPASEDYLIPTSVAFAGAKPEHIDYPPSIPFKPAFSEKPINVYEGRVVIAASFPPGTLDRTRVLALTVTAQACTDRICLPPAEIPAAVE